MKPLALIGKNISHSKSKSIYEKILKKSIDYSLIDCPSENEIPDANSLFEKFHGVSITSPYKEFFIDKVYLDKMAKDAGSVNCLKNNGSNPIGTSTDYNAVYLQLEEILTKYEITHTFILGNGCMSKITQKILDKKNLPYEIFSRKNKNLHLLDTKNAKQSLIINSCSRDFIFKGSVENYAIFLDFNYNFPPHQNSLPSKTLKYIDGYHILELQAFHSLKFWGMI